MREVSLALLFFSYTLLLIYSCKRALIESDPSLGRLKKMTRVIRIRLFLIMGLFFFVASIALPVSFFIITKVAP